METRANCGRGARHPRQAQQRQLEAVHPPETATTATPSTRAKLLKLIRRRTRTAPAGSGRCLVLLEDAIGSDGGVGARVQRLDDGNVPNWLRSCGKTSPR